MTGHQPPPGAEDTPAPPEVTSGSTASSRRKAWLITGVLALVIVGGGGGLWLIKEAHKAHNVVMPATLLGLSRYTGPGAASDIHQLQQTAETELLISSTPVVGLYGNVPGHPALAVITNPPCGGGTCVLPASSQIVQSLKNSGDPDVRTFPLGGGLIVCNTFQGSTEVHCAWVDQVTSGNVFFAAGFVSGLGDAAAETRQIRAAVEH